MISLCAAPAVSAASMNRRPFTAFRASATPPVPTTIQSERPDYASGQIRPRTELTRSANLTGLLGLSRTLCVRARSICTRHHRQMHRLLELGTQPWGVKLTRRRLGASLLRYIFWALGGPFSENVAMDWTGRCKSLANSQIWHGSSAKITDARPSSTVWKSKDLYKRVFITPNLARPPRRAAPRVDESQF